MDLQCVQDKTPATAEEVAEQESELAIKDKKQPLAEQDWEEAKDLLSKSCQAMGKLMKARPAL